MGEEVDEGQAEELLELLLRLQQEDPEAFAAAVLLLRRLVQII